MSKLTVNTDLSDSEDEVLQKNEESLDDYCPGGYHPVKIGEKFGLRITSLTLPEERLVPLTKAPPVRR